MKVHYEVDINQAGLDATAVACDGKWPFDTSKKWPFDISNEQGAEKTRLKNDVTCGVCRNTRVFKYGDERKVVVHWLTDSRFRQITLACGISWRGVDNTRKKENVTCGNCKRTKEYRNA